MQKPSVLIVGAGAVGVVVGYHLALAGAEVSFLVRPARAEALRRPQVLYCYDDHQLKNFSGYRVFVSVAEVSAQRFDYVLVTLDGATCRADEGRKLLGEVADAIRATPARMIIGGVGIGLREHYAQVTGLPQDRLLEATLGCLSHQVERAALPVHAPTDAARLAQASIAYHHFPNRVGLMMAAQPRRTGRDFARLYDRCGVSRCAVMNASLYRVVTNAFFPLTAACDLAGWPEAKQLARNKPLVSLCVQAMKDICGLPQHGLLGQVARLALTRRLLLMVVGKLERQSLPLDFHAFNRFHHGGKVRSQDVQVMRNCLAAGEAARQPMAGLRHLLREYEAKALRAA